MSSFEKYRVHEVAKDFNMTSKAIAEILTKYATAPKNHMQVLEDGELSVIFDYLTQHNQCESMEDLFKIPAKPEQPKAAEKSAEKGAEPAKPAPQQPEFPQPALQQTQQPASQQPQQPYQNPYSQQPQQSQYAVPPQQPQQYAAPQQPVPQQPQQYTAPQQPAPQQPAPQQPEQIAAAPAFCPSCGVKSNGEKFCQNCGAPLH